MRTAPVLALSLVLLTLGCSSGPTITPTDYPGKRFERRGTQVVLWHQYGEWYQEGDREYRTSMEVLAAPESNRRSQVRLLGYAAPGAPTEAPMIDGYPLSPDEAVRLAATIDAFAEGLADGRDDLSMTRLEPKTSTYSNGREAWATGRVEYAWRGKITRHGGLGITWGTGLDPSAFSTEGGRSAYVKMTPVEMMGLAQALRNAAAMARDDEESGSSQRSLFF